jgi:hypothetical protein
MVTYETGVATDPADLLSKLITFITANGWTSSAPASGDAVIHNGGSGIIYAGIDATTTQWQRRGCTGYSGAAAWNAQPGAATVTDILDLGAGPYTAYHFYLGDEDGYEYVHVSVEISANIFRHWTIGQLVPSGTYDGGVYCDSTEGDASAIFSIPFADYGGVRHICDATNSTKLTGHLWVDYDGKASPNWAIMKQPASLASDDDMAFGSGRGDGLWASYWPTQDQSWNLRTALFPCEYFVARASGLASPVGRIPNLRFVSMRNFDPGEIVSYGGQQWQVFPVFQRHLTQPGTGILSSGLYGYAHLRP